MDYSKNTMLERLSYNKYCKSNKIDPKDKASAKMYYFYKEAEAASTDCNLKEDMSYNLVMTECQAVWYGSATNVATAISFAPISPQEACKPAYPVPCQKGNNPMYVDNDKHIESSKINYLTERAALSFHGNKSKAFEAFNMNTPKAPETPEALVEAITSGNYTIPPKAERCLFDRVTSQIIWRNPSVKADAVGFEKAVEQLKQVYQDTKDTIAIGTPAEGLAAVKALDAWTPTVGNA